MTLALSKNVHPSKETSFTDLSTAIPRPLHEDARYLGHDARNWLTVLQVYCDLLQNSGAVRTGYERWMEELSGAVKRGHGLVASLLESLPETMSEDPDPTRTSAGATSVGHIPASVDVGTVLIHRLPLLERLAGDNIHIEIGATPDIGKAMLSESALERILYNLVNNAIEAMPNGGRLRITARRGSHSVRGACTVRPSKTVVLRVADTGNGISPQLLPNIFKSGISGKARGKGLSGLHGYGLPIVRELAEQAGGAVRVRSHPGHGTCFEVKLPRA